MPELPEVETIKRDLEKVILGKKITEVCVHNPKIIREPGLAAFKKGLTGTVIKKILRKAKVLILELSSGKSLVMHLKMTGQLVYPGGSKNSRVAFHLSGGKILDFNDQRLFAELRLLDDWRSLKFIQSLGPEPADLSLQQFKEILNKKKAAIKPLLMDQRFISGIGNIYASEILFQAKIRPWRRANELKDKEKELLFKAINDILKAAILHGGSSVDDYVRVSGEKGGYLKYHKVYGRAGKPCAVCKTTVQKINQGGRGTYFCPKCQK
jgi:formamidopyrimidine-DNA glycosylase